MTARSVLGGMAGNDNGRSERIAESNRKRTLRLNARRMAAAVLADDPMVELLGAARSGDLHAAWRADQLYVNWRRGRKFAVED